MEKNHKLSRKSKKKLPTTCERVSETENESSDNEIKNHSNIGANIKTEPPSTSEDSESDSPDKVLTQVSSDVSASEQSDSETITIHGTKKGQFFEANYKSSDTLNDSGNSSHKNRENVNKQTFTPKPHITIFKQTGENSDETSSSSGKEDILKNAFLQNKQSLNKTTPSPKNQANQEIGINKASKVIKQKSPIKKNNHEIIVLENINQKSKQMTKSANKEYEIKHNREVHNQSLSSGGKQQVSVAENSSVYDSEPEIPTSNKVQVLEHIKLTPMKPQDLLLDLHPNKIPVIFKKKFNIFSDEPVYIIRIPKAIDPQNLINKELDFNSVSELKINKEKYVLEPTNRIPDPLLFIGKETKIFLPNKFLLLKKHIKPTRIPELHIDEKSVIPLPANLKRRHPLFGSSYKDKLLLSEEAKIRLDKAIDDCLKQTKKDKMQKKKKKKSSILESCQNEVIFGLLDKHITQKPVHVEEQSDSAFSSSGSHNIPNKEKKDNSIEDSFLKTTSNEIDKFPNKKKKSHNIGTIKAEIINACDDYLHNSTTSIEEISVINSLDHSTMKKFKKSKKLKSEDEQTIFESTRIDYSNSKTQNLINECLSNVKTELLTKYEGKSTKKKTKKKHKSHSHEETIDYEILSNVKQEIMSDDIPLPLGKRKRTQSEGFSKVSKKSKKFGSLNSNAYV